MTKEHLKGLSLLLSLIGLGVSLAGLFVDEKIQKKEIASAVADYMANH